MVIDENIIYIIRLVFLFSSGQQLELEQLYYMEFLFVMFWWVSLLLSAMHKIKWTLNWYSSLDCTPLVSIYWLLIILTGELWHRTEIWYYFPVIRDDDAIFIHLPTIFILFGNIILLSKNFVNAYFSTNFLLPKTPFYEFFIVITFQIWILTTSNFI